MRDRHDLSLGAVIGKQRDQVWGAPTADMFAVALNTRCARFFSQMRTPGCEEFDAFSIGWWGPEHS